MQNKSLIISIFLTIIASAIVIVGVYYFSSIQKKVSVPKEKVITEEKLEYVQPKTIYDDMTREEKELAKSELLNKIVQTNGKYDGMSEEELEQEKIKLLLKLRK